MVVAGMTDAITNQAALREMWELACEEHLIQVEATLGKRAAAIQRHFNHLHRQYWEKQSRDPAYIRWQASVYRAWQFEYIIPAAFFGAALAVLYIGVWWPT